MPTTSATVVVSDAHLGETPTEVTVAFHRFLEAVPDLADHLVINGDLFEFWFEYRSVIPQANFQTLAALASLRRAGVRLTVIGGNHDRWSAGFMQRELGADFHSGPARIQLGGWHAWVAHGDGIAELDRSGRVLHALTRHPLTIALFRWTHPDLSFKLVRRLSHRLATRRSDQARIARAAAAQALFARNLLAREADLDLVVLGHTHAPTVERVGTNRWYLNPGAWMDGNCYALIDESGPTLQTFA